MVLGHLCPTSTPADDFLARPALLHGPDFQLTSGTTKLDSFLVLNRPAMIADLRALRSIWQNGLAADRGAC